MTEKELKLKVAEAIQDDVNKGIVRVDSTFMKEINVRPGDIVELEGERKTVAIVDRAYPGDIGLNIVRIDGLTRRNAKAGIGELIKVRSAEVKEAKKVVIAPAKKGVVVRASPQLFKQGLLGRAVMKGDVVSLGGTERRRTSMSSSPFFEDIFDLPEDVFGGLGFGFGDLKFIVADVNPKGAAYISEATQVEFNPEAIELEEEEVFPEVSYEDIGGLEEEMKKIREMVELPLKHPEIFERLGIEPPKGVLLHGPPGTGKTLLAKAVANETNSHFILINGPEIMSKFYGQSLPGYEKVLISQNGLLKRVPIRDIVENNMEVEVVCFNKEGKVCIKKSTGLIKHKLNSRILEVTTRSGRIIRVTDDHSLFTIGKKGIEDIKTSQLIENESFIAVPKVIPFTHNPIYEIDLLEHLKEEDYGIVVRNVQKDFMYAIKRLGIKKVASILNVKERYVYDIKSKNIGIGASKYYALMKLAGLEINKDFLQVSTKGKSVPCKLRLTEDLMLFFGLWMAEGSYTNKNEVRLSINRSEEGFVADLCRKLFGMVTIYRKKGRYSSDIYICSGILGKVMRDVLGFNSGSRRKEVPDFVYNLDKSNLSAFLRGFISGDGSLNLSTPAPMVEVVSESKSLSDDITYLMLQFGISLKIYSRKDRPQKRLCFADYENLEKFLEIGFISTEKNREISEYLRTKRFSRRDQVPITGEIHNIVNQNPKLSAWRGSKTVGTTVLQKFENQKLAPLLTGDIKWDKVIAIREIKDETEYVYDISVPGAENFIAGFGGIYAHNSEENLRKKFEEAQKNAPSIIFIDEIDAIASKREEVQGEVERRVVAQLLALMDGLESRGKVVVIAASNIPNALDPALRRPGRFDREIDIGVPDKEGRLKILKIHTRNMPINTNPESINPTLNKDEIRKHLLTITKGITVDEIYDSIPDEKIEKGKLAEPLKDRVKKILYSKIEKNAKKNTKDFIKSCLAKLGEDISNIIIASVQIDEEKNIENKDDIKQSLSEKLKKTANEGTIDNIISDTVREILLSDISSVTHGFVGADLAALAKEAAIIVLRKILPDLKLEEDESISNELLERLYVTNQDLRDALKVVRPSALREVFVESPNVSWSDIGGLESLKQELIEAVEWPQKYPERFVKMGIRPPKGILLYGAPGTGKTLLAKAVATESKSNFISVKGPELLSKWVGESEKGVRKIFQKARQTAPSIIFFDEIDSIASRRGVTDSPVNDKVVNQILTEMDGLEEMNDVVIIAATNRPDMVDPGLLRPGRFDRIILTPAPDRNGREDIFRVHTKKMPLAKEVDIKELAAKTEGYAGADIEAVCREAAMIILRKDPKSSTIRMDAFIAAIEMIPASVTKDIEEGYKELQGQFSSAKAKQMMQEKPNYFG